MPRVKLDSPVRVKGKTHPVGAEVDLDQAIIDALPEGVVAAPVDAGLDEALEQIRAMAADNKAEEWTQSDGPSVQALSRRLGQIVSAELRDAAWAAYQAEQDAGEE